MASRVTVTRVEIPLDPRPRLGVWWQGIEDALADVPNRKLLLWRALWLPYWLGSDVPAPQLPGRNMTVPDGGPAGNQVISIMDQIARRVWTQRALNIMARSCWLGILAGFFWLALELSGGPDLTVKSLVILWVAFLVPGLVLALLARPSRQTVARMLDRSFHLHERMSTALGNLGRELPAPDQRATVVYLQIADTANVATELRHHPAFKVRAPVREIVAAIAIALFLASLFFLRGASGHIPAIADSPVPRFTPATERIAQQAENAAASQVTDQAAPSTAEVEAQAQRSQEARRDLQELAQALDDHAVTRSAADAIQRGDYEAAASELRDLSQNADQLSPEAREGLAQDLEQAAAGMSEGSKELANSSRQAAEGLREGGDPAKEGVRDLGDAVEKTGDEVVSQQELADQMRQAQAAAANGQQAQSSASSQSNDASQAAAESQYRPGQQSNQSGQTGDPNSGADAQPGQGQQPSNQEGQEGPQQSSQSQQDAQQGGQQGAQGQQGQSDQPAGDGQEPGQGPGGQPDPNLSGQPNDSETGASSESNRGDGAGSGANGEQENNGETGSNQDGGGQEGQPPSADLVENDQKQGKGTGPQEDPRDAVQLARSPDGESVQTSGDSGSSTLGSGSGVSVSGGTSVQGEVGQAGPDSNRVPPAYRSLVESYFSSWDD
jgi:hypothetical protein